MSPKAAALADRLLARFEPPEEIKLSDWSEKHIVLPGASARPGELRNWPYMRDILDSIGDPLIERVTVMKSARLGYTKGLMFAMAATAATDPCPIILLVPTDDDAKGIAVDEVEPIFEASDALDALVKKGRTSGTTQLRKSLVGGGSIKILSAVAPRKLRRHDCKVLLIDEADAMSVTAEGDPVLIAEKRTMAQVGRKIVMGSTPVEEGVSYVERGYLASDQRVFKVPCHHCGVFSEIKWEAIEWEPDRPETAAWKCPACAALVDERWKPAMVEAGVWIAQRPEVIDHHGYQIGALVSLLANASWGKLAKEFIQAKRQGPSAMQPFRNTVLGLPYRMTVSRVDAAILAERIEGFGLATVDRKLLIPREVLLITVGADVQDDRIEATVLGWRAEGGAPLVLGHLQFDGNTLGPGVWAQFDRWLKIRWRHPLGWQIGIDGCAIDSGGREGRTQVVYDFCHPRLARRIFAIKGIAGPRKVWERAKKVKGNMRLYNIGVDVMKTTVMDALATPPFDENGIENIHGCRYSDQLREEWFEQVTNETRRIKYVGKRAEIHFEPKRTGVATEALDCMVYGWAVRLSPGVRAIDIKAREAREPEPELKPGDKPEPKGKKPGGGWGAVFNT